MTPGSCDISVPKPGSKKAPHSKSDSDFSIQQRKRMLIEKIKGIKPTRSEINSKNVTLSKICDGLPKNKSIINKNTDVDVKLNSGNKRKHALKVQKATKTTEVKSCGFKSLSTPSLAADFSDGDKNLVSAMESHNQKPEIVPFKFITISNSNEILSQETEVPMKVKDEDISNQDKKFDRKYVFDLHSNVVHGEEVKVKKEPVIKEEKFVELQQSGKEFEEPYKCNNCRAAFQKKSCLNRHVTTVHEGNKPFKCTTCDTSFAQKHTLKRLLSFMN